MKVLIKILIGLVGLMVGFGLACWFAVHHMVEPVQIKEFQGISSLKVVPAESYLDGDQWDIQPAAGYKALTW